MVFGLSKLLGIGSPAADAASAPAPASLTPQHFVLRDAVFNRERRIVGHLYRLSRPEHDGGAAPLLPADASDAALLRALGNDNAGWGSRLGFVPIASSSLNSPLLLKLPQENTVLLVSLVDESGEPDVLLERLSQLRSQGLRFGLFRNPKHPAFAPLLAVSDVGAIDVAEAQGNNVRDFSAALRSRKDVHHPVELFGANIETIDDVLLCRRCHFSYFHGPFARAGESWQSQKSGNPHKMHLMHLFNLVQSDAENREIAHHIKQDPILTFRILRYLNSPAIALIRTITSIDEALVLLGRQKLMRWLSVLLFSVKDPDYADWLLVETSLCRGRLMELLGDELPGVESDHLFLTGIFSTLDRILHVPLPEALEQLKLPDEIQNALLCGQGPYAPLLAVAEASDGQNSERIALAAERCKLDAKRVNQALIEATAWASKITTNWE